MLECTHPQKLNLQNGKDHLSAKFEPLENFLQYSFIIQTWGGSKEYGFHHLIVNFDVQANDLDKHTNLIVHKHRINADERSHRKSRLGSGVIRRGAWRDHYPTSLCNYYVHFDDQYTYIIAL